MAQQYAEAHGQRSSEVKEPLVPAVVKSLSLKEMRYAFCHDHLDAEEETGGKAPISIASNWNCRRGVRCAKVSYA